MKHRKLNRWSLLSGAAMAGTALAALASQPVMAQSNGVVPPDQNHNQQPRQVQGMTEMHYVTEMRTDGHDIKLERKVTNGNEEINLWVDGNPIKVNSIDEANKKLADMGIKGIHLGDGSMTMGQGGQGWGQMFNFGNPAPPPPPQAGPNNGVIPPRALRPQPLPNSHMNSAFTPPKTMIGIQMAAVPDALGNYLGLAPGEGVMIRKVLDKTPAADAGLQDDDIITGMTIKNEVHDDITVASMHDLIANCEPGDKMTITVLRRGHKKQFDVTLAKWNSTLMQSASPQAPINLNNPNNNGVVPPGQNNNQWQQFRLGPNGPEIHVFGPQGFRFFNNGPDDGNNNNRQPQGNGQPNQMWGPMFNQDQIMQMMQKQMEEMMQQMQHLQQQQQHMQRQQQQNPGPDA